MRVDNALLQASVPKRKRWLYDLIMAIMARKQGDKWGRAEKVIFGDEAQLQKMLYDSPELIPTKLEGQAAVFTREAGLPGSGSTDLIGVDAQGNVLVVETKLARNSEIRRKVIGQVLEYAAYLWRMEFEDFDNYFVHKEGKSLIDLLGDKDPKIDGEQLRKNVEDNLASGAFQLVIAVDAINPELEKIIAYVSNRGSGLQLEALELELYRPGQLEILVPKRYGQPTQPQPSKKMLTFEQILDNCPDEHARNLLGVLEDLWKAAGNYVKPGTAGASFQVQIGGRSHPIFWAFRDALQNAFSEISKHGAPPDAFETYRQSVAKLPGFSREDVLTKPNPTTKFSKLTESTIRAFLADSQVLVDAWRKLAES